ncbi:hypothetical protein GCM10010317_003150 [Streptomyces mirabilis]|jgi:hypothetical protein|nr:hypothetical protein GCM10010317_003150 [Streptomyces mirabilis]
MGRRKPKPNRAMRRMRSEMNTADLPGAEQRITAGGRGLFEQRIPAQRLRTAPHVSAFHRNRMATWHLFRECGEG